jgi:hypothetical protein
MAKFEERFGLVVGVDEARERFVNRVHLTIFTRFVSFFASQEQRYVDAVVVGLGRPPRFNAPPLREIVGRNFHDNLKAIEYIHRASPRPHQGELDQIVGSILGESEVDLGIRWENGVFVKAGAPLLDDRLVRDVLGWARDKKYETVIAPFEKGLRHFLESTKRPELLSDVVTDMYEALEAVAKIVTDRNADLSSNRERFIKVVRAPDAYKKLLKEYIDYGCEFRHAADASEQKPALSPEEVESFIYLTGIFVRFAMKKR